MSPRPQRWRAMLRAVLFLVMNLVLVPLYAVARGPARSLQRPLQVAYCRICLRIVGLRLRVIGTPASGGSVLFAANHVSYLDIPVLAAHLDAAFVAKAEVAHWPLLGIIAKLTRTIFVQRSGSDAMSQRLRMSQCLAAGNSLILFPEGTSTDGARVAPFKSSLFSIATHPDTEVTVQPVSIAYVRYADGTRLIGPLRALYCWYGDATLVPHMVRVLGLAGAEVELSFHAPLRAAVCRDRKELARRAYEAVAAGVAAAHGRSVPTNAAISARLSSRYDG